MIKSVTAMYLSTDSTALVTDEGYIMEPISVSPRFEIELIRPTAIRRIETRGPLYEIMLYNRDSGATIQLRLPECPDLSGFRSLLWTHVQLVFGAVTTATNIRAQLRPFTTTPLVPCTVAQDMALKAAGGSSVWVSSALALAACERLQAAKSMGQLTDAVDLSEFSHATVESLRDAIQTAEVPNERLTPELVRAMYYMLLVGKEKVWRTVRKECMHIGNVQEWLLAAHQLGDDKTAKRAKDLIVANIKDFEVVDIEKFCSCIKPM